MYCEEQLLATDLESVAPEESVLPPVRTLGDDPGDPERAIRHERLGRLLERGLVLNRLTVGDILRDLVSAEKRGGDDGGEVCDGFAMGVEAVLRLPVDRESEVHAGCLFRQDCCIGKISAAYPDGCSHGAQDGAVVGLGEGEEEAHRVDRRERKRLGHLERYREVLARQRLNRRKRQVSLVHFLVNNDRRS